MIFDILLLAIIVLVLLWKFKGVLGQEDVTSSLKKQSDDFSSIKNVTGTAQDSRQQNSIKKIIGISQKQSMQNSNIVNLSGLKFNVSQDSSNIEKAIKDFDLEAKMEEYNYFSSNEALEVYKSLLSDVKNQFIPSVFISAVCVMFEELFSAISERNERKLSVLSELALPELLDFFKNQINDLIAKSSFVFLVKIKSAKISHFLYSQTASSSIQVDVDFLALEYSTDENGLVISGSKKDLLEKNIKIVFQTVSLSKPDWKILKIV